MKIQSFPTHPHTDGSLLYISEASQQSSFAAFSYTTEQKPHRQQKNIKWIHTPHPKSPEAQRSQTDNNLKLKSGKLKAQTPTPSEVGA